MKSIVAPNATGDQAAPAPHTDLMAAALADRARSRLLPLLQTSPALRDDTGIARFVGLVATASPQKLAAWLPMAARAGLSPAQIDEIGLTLELGRLTHGDLPLANALQALRGDGRIRKPADLLDLDESEWQALTRRSTDQAIASLKRELRKAYPMRDLRNVVADAPAIDWAAIRRIMDDAPDFARRIRPPVRPDRQEVLAVPDDAADSALADLRREVRAYPDFDWRAAMHSPEHERLANPIRAGVVRFLGQAEDFDLRTDRVDAYVADHPRSMDGMNSAAAVIAQLKRMQRVYRIVPDAQTMQGLLGEGLHSASRIARMPVDVFIAHFGALLGEGAAATIHATALGVAATAAALAWSARLRIAGPLPAAVGTWPPPELSLGRPGLEQLLRPDRDSTAQEGNPGGTP